MDSTPPEIDFKGSYKVNSCASTYCSKYPKQEVAQFQEVTEGKNKGNKKKFNKCHKF